MKLEKIRETYYDDTSKTSDLVRNLGFAGFAIVWVFKESVEGVNKVPEGLFVPSLFLVATLSFDLMHYVTRSLTWGGYHRFKEKRVNESEEFMAPSWINWPANSFFILKIVAVMIAYVTILLWFLNNH